ncbi:hypothetical protein BJX76DRAFT_354101 [Aspergillus varians]
MASLLRKKRSLTFSFSKTNQSANWLSRLLARLRSNPQYTKEVEDHGRMNAQVPSLPISDLSTQLVQYISQLKIDTVGLGPWEPREDEKQELSFLLKAALDRYELATSRSVGIEALIRTRIPTILLTLPEQKGPDTGTSQSTAMQITIPITENLQIWKPTFSLLKRSVSMQHATGLAQLLGYVEMVHRYREK